MNELIQTLLSAAILAPSGDNTQPWRFEIDNVESAITVLVDETRDVSPMNAGQRMARIACGAAIENILQTARYNDLDVIVDLLNDPVRLATVHISGAQSPANVIPSPITSRHTNRRVYDGQELSESITVQLNENAQGRGEIYIAWVTKREEIDDFGRLIGRADAVMFGQSAFLRAFLANVRFDLPPDSLADEGLPVASLELAACERRLLPMLRHAPEAVLQRWPIMRSFQAKSQKLVKSASGLCLVVSQVSGPIADVRVGQLMQRAWLHLVELGYQVQPMMSIPVLASVKEHQQVQNLSIDALLNGIDVGINCSGTNRLPAAILRFGRADAASARTGRKKLIPLEQG